MPQPPNRFLRIIVPLVLGLVAVAVAVAVFQSSNSSPTAPPGNPPAGGQGPANPPAPDQAATPGPPSQGEPQGATPPAAPGPAPAKRGLRAVTVAQAALTPIGALDPASPMVMNITFSPVGAGVAEIRLNRTRETIRRDSPPTLVQRELRLGEAGLTPFAALALYIDGEYVGLTGVGAGGPIWRETAPGAFAAEIVDEAGTPVARIEREYVLAEGSYDLILRQRIINLTQAALRVQLFQFGACDLPDDKVSYGGEKRRVRFGYLLSPGMDPSRTYVTATDYLWPRSDAKVMGPKDAGGLLAPSRTVWPNARSAEQRHELVWVGMTNRYFGVSVHALRDAGSPSPALAQVDQVDRVLLDTSSPLSPMALRLRTPEVTVAAGGTSHLSLGAYVGPLSGPVIAKEPQAGAVGVAGIVVYNFGGWCAPCTFPWLTSLLLWVMRTLHDYVLFDWSLAIIVLVVTVRSVLHPVTRWSQIRIQKFSKQMQALAPKQKALQEKYGADRKKMQEEMTRLWREEGVNPAGMLGCLSPLLQSPVWIALYAMLYFAYDLRHEPAFFGLFQAIQPAGSPFWLFLGDLAEPDRFIYFNEYYHIPLLSGLMGKIGSINVLPVILGVVFWLHQKILTPPTATPLTPEQEQQQKITKWMMVIMFPLMMYNAPSGLAIYFIANSTFAILENKWIKHSIDKHKLLEPKRAATRSGGGLSSWLRDMSERQKALLEKRTGRRSGFGSRSETRPAPPGKGASPGKPPPKRFKNR